MAQIFLIILSFLLNFPVHAQDYTFKGKHFVASYLDCDPNSISDFESLIQAMNSAVSASGATILDQTHYVFPPDGLTIVYLLSESHASLHTYPEHRACFVDLFTCGDHCSSKKFDEVLRKYLRPKQVNDRLFTRSEEVEDLLAR
ncbi:MAG: adenosylmethionine decarboxylase [Chlamydiae bacterium CG10_big_fil_rev_8_21_14_0_10_42_34]|nr:MAG: adenosylmethionine decarboxylase [Chlamydiae bacterium CG10_big_fil_rev_8_21_14_0_10_42_34]